MFIHLLNRERTENVWSKSKFLFENENVFGISRGTINESPERKKVLSRVMEKRFMKSQVDERFLLKKRNHRLEKIIDLHQANAKRENESINRSILPFAS
jgi:hypothetical protein